MWIQFGWNKRWNQNNQTWTGLTALTTSILMILIGQANAWYANQPEDNIVKDIKRKIKIAILLMIPNAATLGSALMIALTVISTDDPIKSWNAIVLGIGLMVSLGSFCAYWACICRPLPFCSIQTRGMKLHFFKIYPKYLIHIVVQKNFYIVQYISNMDKKFYHC